MKRRIASAVLCTCLVVLCGCIEMDTVIYVKPDGSGTLAQSVLIRKAVRKQMNAMLESMIKGIGTEGIPGIADTGAILDEKELRQKAAELGEGVTFVSAEPYHTSEAEGYKAVYAFKDISRVSFNQNPGETALSNSQPAREQIKEFVTFGFEKGPVSTLIIKRPAVFGDSSHVGRESADSLGAGNKLDEASKEALEQMKQMFEGFRVAVSIEVEGKIEYTNATYVKGNRIVLMDMDFEKLLKSPEQLDKFAQLNPQSVEEAKEIVKNVPGIKVDLNEQVVVKFAAAQK